MVPGSNAQDLIKSIDPLAGEAYGQVHDSKTEQGRRQCGGTRKVKDPMRQRNFPSAGGLCVGGLILAISLIAQAGDPASATVRDFLITLSAVFTGANAVGLLELRRRQDVPDVLNKKPT